MPTYTPEQLKEILHLHGKWLRDEPAGKRANLADANLTYANLTDANLTDANLTRANLTYANLAYANLAYANLTNVRSFWGTIGNMAEIKSIQVDTWPVTYTATHMQIGCQLHPLSDWWAFDDEQIGDMDRKALGWWAKAKPVLRAWIESYPATGAAQ